MISTLSELELLRLQSEPHTARLSRHGLLPSKNDAERTLSETERIPDMQDGTLAETLPERLPILVWIYLETLSVEDLLQFGHAQWIQGALFNAWMQMRRRPHGEEAVRRAGACLHALDQARERRDAAGRWTESSGSGAASAEEEDAANV